MHDLLFEIRISRHWLLQYCNNSDITGLFATLDYLTYQNRIYTLCNLIIVQTPTTEPRHFYWIGAAKLQNTRTYN